MPVISFGWLKCVWRTTSLCSLRPVDDARHGVHPVVVRQDLLRHHGRTLRRDADALQVRDREERLADRSDLLGAEVVRVAAGDDDVLKLGARRDVSEGPRPPLVVDLEVRLLDLVRVDADRVAARAEPAVDGARVERKEQRLVHVAVREARHRGVLALVKRVEPELGVVRQHARAKRDELRAQRIAVRVAPVDEAHQVRRHAHAHGRLGEALRRVLDELRRDHAAEGVEQLVRPRDRALRLPVVVQELLVGDVLVRRDAAKIRDLAELRVHEPGLVDAGLQVHDLVFCAPEPHDVGGGGRD
jgi:hypothetical protein